MGEDLIGTIAFNSVIRAHRKVVGQSRVQIGHCSLSGRDKFLLLVCARAGLVGRLFSIMDVIADDA